jgi:diketogulonate reductase-like aldo/keto reductase
MYPEWITDAVDLTSGTRMPLLGVGTFRSEPGRETADEVSTALRIGYKSIDTASMYRNEESVGQAMRTSGLARDELFVATKVWNDEQGYDETLAAFDRSLARLGLDYVDLYLVHWPLPRLMTRTWHAMEEIFRSGRARAIGVCNHLIPHLESLLSFAEIPPAVNQVEFHPRLQQPALQDFCAQHRIQIEAWAPIMRGGVFKIPQILQIAQEHEKTAAQVTLRWIVQKGLVAIPKSVHEDRLRENADLFDFELSPAQMQEMDALDSGQRIGRHPDSWRT